MLDLAIIGSGPAAMSAALYAARAGLHVHLYEALDYGGALSKIDHIENYPGFSGSGAELSQHMRAQAESAGAKFHYGKCTNIELTTDAAATLRRADVSASATSAVREGANTLDDSTSSGVSASNRHVDASPLATNALTQRSVDAFLLTIDEEPVRTRSVLIATGSEPRALNFDIKPPVSYCALCDGPLAKGKRVAVVGGANSAVQEALYLADLAASVTIITHSALKADSALRDRLPAVPNLSIQEHTEPTPALLDQFDYVFVYIGKRPATACLRPLADSLLSATPLLSPDGYVITGLGVPSIDTSRNASTSHRPTSTTIAQTSTPPSMVAPHATIVSGLFAAGDVRQGSVQQVVTAAADGAAAAIEISAYLHQA